MHLLAITWFFKIKLVDSDGTRCFYKSVCCIRGAKPIADIGYDPFGRHAPVASPDAVRILLACVAAYSLHVDG